MDISRKLAASAPPSPDADVSPAAPAAAGSTEIKDASADFGFQEEGFPIVNEQLDADLLRHEGAARSRVLRRWTWCRNGRRTPTSHQLGEPSRQGIPGEEEPHPRQRRPARTSLFNTGLTDAEIVHHAASGTLLPLEGPDREERAHPHRASSRTGPTSGPRSPPRTGTSTRCPRWRSSASCSTPTN